MTTLAERPSAETQKPVYLEIGRFIAKNHPEGNGDIASLAHKIGRGSPERLWMIHTGQILPNGVDIAAIAHAYKWDMSKRDEAFALGLKGILLFKPAEPLTLPQI